jgi:Protein of unknown function (DUF3631)
MRIPSDAVCKRIANLWALANDPSSEHESAVAREMLCKLQAELGLSDFLLTYIIERQQKVPGEFDPIEIMLNLFEQARAKLTPEQEIVVALWDVHTYVYDHYRHTPRLVFRSYDAGCGKTALMSLLDQTVANSFPISDTTAATIYYHLRDNPCSTILIDEGEHNPALWSGDKLLLNIFDSGHRQGGFATVGRVISGKPVRFPTFAAYALAYVEDKHKLPVQSLSRAIVIEMMENAEGRDEFDLQHPLLGRFRAEMPVWGSTFKRPENVSFPKKFAGRVLDNWRVLIEIGDVLGYVNTTRAAALAIQGAIENMANVLVLDICRVFDQQKIDQVWTNELLDGLHQCEDARWSVFFGIEGTRDPHPLTASELYRLLRRKGIKPRTIWKYIDGKRRSNNGFKREQFERVRKDISGDTATQSSKIIALPRHSKRHSDDTGE